MKIARPHCRPKWRLVSCCLLISSALALAGDTASDLAKQSRIYADPNSTPGKTVFTAEDEQLLDDLERRGIQFYIDEADPTTGLMPDRAKADGRKAGDVASI